MKPAEFKMSISNEENYQNCYIAEKRIVSKLSRILSSNINSKNGRLEWRLCQISRPYLLYFPRNKPSRELRSDRTGPVHHLNDSNDSLVTICPDKPHKDTWYMFTRKKKHANQVATTKYTEYPVVHTQINLWRSITKASFKIV